MHDRGALGVYAVCVYVITTAFCLLVACCSKLYWTKIRSTVEGFWICFHYRKLRGGAHLYGSMWVAIMDNVVSFESSLKVI